mmetsp:Transcript_26034/g.46177  ORF Transcript_26034/g.46177 Transcript_26034/m.46177 type:complete len:1276 (+) Transcript_26034:21-3848(+)
MDRAPRLMIERVVLENFKSYAGVKEIGPFHKCFTSVVGPNGSGKSNLLEALLFAFGKRATKMRLKKLSDLIHQSREHPNLKHASVAVYFQDILDTGDQTFDVVPGSRLELKRKVKANGENSYYLNNTKSTFEQVTTVLKERGIDLEHNRFLILQGEVEQIALMKPKGTVGEDGKTQTTGLLEYLEEIIGTNVFVDQLKVSEEEIDKAGEDVTSSQLRVNQAAEGLKSMEATKNEAVDRLKLELDRLKFSAFLHMLKRRETENELDLISAGQDEAKQRLTDLRQEWKRLQDANTETLAKFKEVEEDLQKTDKLIRDKEKEFQTHKLKDSELTTKKSVLTTSLKETVADLELEENRARRQVQEHSEAQINVPQLERRRADIVNKREELTPKLEELEVQVMTLTEEKRKQLQKLEQELLPFSAKYEEAVSQCKITEDKIRHMTNERDDKVLEMDKLANDIRNTQNLLESRQVAFEEAKTKQANAERNHATCEAELARVQSELADIDNNLKVKQDEARRLERKNEKGESKSKLMQEIGRAVQNEELHGILGRLGDLGSIAPSFDIAVSNGVSRLNDIVVETVTHAEALIDFVRRRGLGKVNTILLDRMTQNYGESARRPFRLPSSKVVRLFDQIQMEDLRLAPVFYFAMRDTLVAKNVDDARATAFGEERYRVVTLGGDIFEASGTMQGFSQPKRGLMRTEAVAGMQDTARLSTLTAEINVLKEQYASVNNRKNELAQHLPNLRKVRGDCEHEVKLMTDEIASLQQKISILGKRREQARRDSDAITDSEIEKHQKYLHATMLMIGKLTQNIEIRKDQMKKVQASIDEEGGAEYIQLKKQCQALDLDKAKTERDLNTAISRLQQLEADIKKSTKRIEDLQAKRVTIEQEIAKIKAEKVEIETKCGPILELLQSATQKKGELDTMHQEMLKKNNEIAEAFEAIKKDLSESKQRLADLNSKFNNKKTEEQKQTTQLEYARNEVINFLSEFRIMIQSETDTVPEEGEKPEEPLEKRFKVADFNLLRKSINFDVLKDIPKIELDVYLSQFKDIRVAMTRIEDECERTAINSNIIAEYQRLKQEYDTKDEELQRLKKTYEDKRSHYSELKNERHDLFTKDFKIISGKLREMYQMITRGGDAELEFADSTDPFSEGIVFTVRPPKKSWKKMANLSGGEKTLSSLALVFALHHYKPTALYVMDEVDAALDFQNVSIIANYIKSRTKNAQFVIVSLRYQMFELADRLIGVYKTNDVTRTVSLSPCSLLESTSSNPIIQQTLRNLSGDN